MMGKNCILIIFLVSILSVSTVSALNSEDIDFGPSLQILDSSKRDIDISKPILNNIDLSFKLTLTNSLNYWICWKNWYYTLKITKVGETKNYNIQESFSGEECLPPNDKKEIWILFKEYNEMKEEQRIGKWRIEPSASLSNIECYESTTFKKTSCWGSPSFSGNMKEFEVVKEEPTTHPTFYNLWKWLTTGYNFIYGLLGFIFLLISVILGLKKLFGK